MNLRLNAQSALLIALLYPILAVVAGLLARILFGSVPAQGDTNIYEFIGIGMYGTIITSIVLIFVSVYVFKGSRNDIYFERKPFSLSPLYYLFPLVLVGVTLFALFNVDWSAYSVDVVLLVILATLAIGFNEEVVTRGILLVGLRNSRVAEWLVFVITLAVFSLYHLVNLLSGGSLMVLLVTFTGGVIYYISRRVFNNLFAPIALHAFYDTGFFLLPGSTVAGADLPDNVLDVQFGAFLIVLVASIVFLIFGRKLLRDETVGWA
jgi:membrane protease YdiL (CAAX protease family)